MHKLTPRESRKVLDTMEIPVVVLRHRSIRSVSQGQCHLVNELPTSMSSNNDQIGEIGNHLGHQMPNEIESGNVEQGSSAGSSDTFVSVDKAYAVHHSQSNQVNPFSLVSVTNEDTLLLFELPQWSGRLLDGRMTNVLRDLLRILSSSREAADWQYFHWPIDGIASHSKSAATDAVEAWFNRRWAETQIPDPVILISVQSIDLTAVTRDAIILPKLEYLMTSVEIKKSAWGQLRTK